MKTVTYVDESPHRVELTLPEPGSVWERVPHIKSLLPEGMWVRDVPKRVEVRQNNVNPESLVLIRDLRDGKEDAFHPLWFKKYYKEVEDVRQPA